MTNTNKGGYQILDLGNIDLTTSPTIEGLYELIEGTKKPIRLTRINLGGVEKHDVVSIPVVSGSDYVFQNVYGYDISIDSDDNVSLASTAIVYKSTIEGGTLDNAKPVYCHPLQLTRISGTTQFAITCLIFNNDPTPFTLSTLKEWLDNVYLLSGESVILMASGYYKNDSDEITSMSYIYKSKVTLNYGVAGGQYNSLVIHSVASLNFNDIFDSDNTTFVDGVNKIN